MASSSQNAVDVSSSRAGAADLEQAPVTELAATLASRGHNGLASSQAEISKPPLGVHPAQAAAQKPSQPAGGFRTVQLSESAMDEVVHFQITHLGRQVLVWVGLGGAPAALGNLAMSMPGVQYGTNSPSAAVPQAPATVLIQSTNAEAAAALAQKLTKRFGIPVLLAWNVPSAHPVLGAWAERRLVQHLNDVLQPAGP